MFGFGQKRAAAQTGAKPVKLHSIAGMLKGRTFAGSFGVAGRNYNFEFTPTRAAASANKLELTGSMLITDPRSNAGASPRSAGNVKATLLAAQGGIGTAPARAKLPSDVSTAHPDLPVVESTGSLSFSGALYFKLAQVDGRALGVPADLRQLQLNVRLAPVSDVERALQGAFSSVVDALYGAKVDSNGAKESVEELNKLLGS